MKEERLEVSILCYGCMAADSLCGAAVELLRGQLHRMMDRDIARGRLSLFETVALVLYAVMMEM